MARELPRVYALYATDAVARQVLGQARLRSPAAVAGAQLAHHQPRNPGSWRLIVGAGDPVVADERGGHRHDLTGIGRIGQDLLVARQARVEYDLAQRNLIVTAGQAAPKHGPVFQNQQASSPCQPCGVRLGRHENLWAPSSGLHPRGRVLSREPVQRAAATGRGRRPHREIRRAPWVVPARLLRL